MSQSKAGYLAGATQVQYPADMFGVVDVAAAYTTTPGDKFFVGEKITGGTSGVTARVSGFISSTKIRVKAIKPGASAAAFSNGETITGNKSTATTTIGTGTLTLANQRLRDIGTGSKVLVTENRAKLTDKGFEVQYWDPSTTTDRTGSFDKTAKQISPFKFTTVATAIRMAASKAQNTDTSVAPTLNYFGPASTATGVVYSKAAASRLRFRIASNEAVTIAGGVPAISFSFNGAGTVVSAGGVTSILGDGTTVTIVYVAAPGYKVGQQFTVAGTTVQAGYNKSYTVASVSADGKTVTALDSASGAGAVCTSSTSTYNQVQWARYNATASTTTDLYFDYALGGLEATGALVSTTAWQANGATVTDAGGTTVTVAANPTWTPVHTGVTIVA